MTRLSIDKINEYEKEFLEDKRNIVAMNAATYNGVQKVARDVNALKNEPFAFNVGKMLDVCFDECFEKYRD